MRENLDIFSELCENKKLHDRDVNRMYNLMEQYFDGMDKQKFILDLADKRWTIVLRDRQMNEIKGFSTITLMKTKVKGKNVNAFYSGDTIIDKTCWSPFSLEKEWTPLVFSHVLSDTETLWYWFMVCKGVRTYKYFYVHFHCFWPSPDYPMPSFEKEVIDVLAKTRFGCQYDPKTFLVNCPQDYRLRPLIDNISTKKSKNRYVRFFEENNPLWLSGVELACLTPLSLNNIKPSLKRFLPTACRPCK